MTVQLASVTEDRPEPGRRPTAQVALRAAGYLIDVLPTILVGLLGLIPIAGPIMVGLVITPYWLLRDVTGASLGKLALNMRVVAANGQPASVASRLIRNVPLAIPGMFMIVPFLGIVVAPAIGLVIILIEAISLFAQGRRVGDMLAGTTVVPK